MRFEATPLSGLVRIEVEPFVDHRGMFARTWCDREAAAAGLRGPMVQQSIGVNRQAGTLRGLHYQAPLPQVRVMRCLHGQAFFAAVDIRRSSPTFLRTYTLVLDARTHSAVYVPPGIAAGYQTLADDTVIGYLMAEFYDPPSERGVRWDDPAFGVRWPDAVRTLNERDASYPDFDPAVDGLP
jgi:dTDP-4-dehydrorhamnose 3,5-epimerase